MLACQALSCRASLAAARRPEQRQVRDTSLVAMSRSSPVADPPAAYAPAQLGEELGAEQVDGIDLDHVEVEVQGRNVDGRARRDPSAADGPRQTGRYRCAQATSGAKPAITAPVPGKTSPDSRSAMPVPRPARAASAPAPTTK